ncbi:poly(A)-specific ribonuclease PARN-like [Phlebotomus argentipes]|uniref:poly(A)-specific ribonuclease PARN-like n=1 Tax=Phlebotomus argentipes TaxID=94469 RepID=UPI002892EA01|nr:poly(A)-specific ribonuclease PARN-like [Phlebotomus argentipes]
MEILETNFSEKLPEIVEAIDRASFVAIDQEFTGLFRENTFSNPYSSIGAHFNRMQKSVDGYIVIQLGITAFWLNPENDSKFQCKSFNIFLYPRGKGSTFRCESSCIEFLVKNGLDFNKLFLQGLSYCTVQEAEKMRSYLEKRQQEKREQLMSAERDNTSHVIVPEEEKETLEEVSEKIDEFLKSEEEELLLDTYNGFQRRLIYEMIERDYFEAISACPRELENNRKGLVVSRKKSPEEEMKLLEEKFEQEKKNLELQIGVTHILKALSESRTLIVCHNMFMDLVYLMKQFIGPLPENVDEYKKLVHEFFPNILDTKFLCTAESLKKEIKSTVLPHILEDCRKAPFTMPEVESLGEQKYSIESVKEHEAGYDSFITGICFISLAIYLKIHPKDLNANCKKLKSFKNKIFLMGLENITHMNLTGPDEKPSRSHVFHITFPSTWKNTDIVRHFRNFGDVQIKWLNKESAFVALLKREYATCLMKKIGRTPNVTVMTHADYEASQVQEMSAGNKRKSSEMARGEVDETSSKKAKKFDENPDWK